MHNWETSFRYVLPRRKKDDFRLISISAGRITPKETPLIRKTSPIPSLRSFASFPAYPPGDQPVIEVPVPVLINVGKIEVMKIGTDPLMDFDVDRVFDPSTLRRKGKVAKCSGYENSLFRPRPRPFLVCFSYMRTDGSIIQFGRAGPPQRCHETESTAL